MATLAFGGPVCDGATNRVVVRDHVDRPRVGPMLPGEGRLAAAPSPGVARVALGRLMDWLAVVMGRDVRSREGPGPSRAGPADRTEPSDRAEPSDSTAAAGVAIRHRLVAVRAPSLEAMTVARQSRSRTGGGSGRHIVTALSLDDDRLIQW